MLLSLIAEKVEGKPFCGIVKERIAVLLKLKLLRALKPREHPGSLALGRQKGLVVKEDCSVPMGARNIVRIARDMLIFCIAY